MNKLYIYLIFVLIAIGCEKKNTEEGNYSNYDKKGAFVINEGNFTRGNASISFIETENKKVHNNIFKNKNGRVIGDVAQSMKIIGNYGYIVVNNSAKIEVVDIATFKSIATITGFNSPRNIIAINSSKAYVTDLKHNVIHVVDLQLNKIVKNILIDNSSEYILKYKNKVFISNWSNGKSVQVIDSDSDELVFNIETVKQPKNIIIDKNNKLWVLCDGGYTGIENQENAAILKINPDNYKIEKKYVFNSIEDYPLDMAIDAEGENLYYINKHIFKMKIDANELPTTPFINNNNRLFYSLDISDNSIIYLSNAIDYQQNGYVFRYQNNGTEIDSYKVGINPGAYCFK